MFIYNNNTGGKPLIGKILIVMCVTYPIPSYREANLRTQLGTHLDPTCTHHCASPVNESISRTIVLVVCRKGRMAKQYTIYL